MVEIDVNQVIAAYEEALENGAARLEEWVRQYPEHEQALVQYAVYHRVTAQAEQPDPAAEAHFLRNARTDIARLRSAALVSAPLTSLLSAAKARGMNIAALAERLGVGKAVAAKLDRRLFEPAGLPKSLVQRVAEALSRSAAEIEAYRRLPPTLSAAASYKSAEAPQIAHRENFAEALGADIEMSQDQKTYWESELNDTLGGEE
jgi:hypothetical protein